MPLIIVTLLQTADVAAHTVELMRLTGAQTYLVGVSSALSS